MVVASEAIKRQGYVRTPLTLAVALCHAAVRSAQDKVLDLGSGDGAFVLAAYQTLRERGGDAEAAANIFGAENDPLNFASLQFNCQIDLGLPAPNIRYGDFFDMDFPQVDAVVGNPPYVKPSHSTGDSLGKAQTHSQTSGYRMGRLADIYVHFIVKATSHLRVGGRLAVVLSSSWLDSGYGSELKRFLLDNYDIELIGSCRTRIFADALVKAVVLIAQRKSNDWPHGGFGSLPRCVRFASVDDLSSLVELITSGTHNPYTEVVQSSLRFEDSWSIHLNPSGFYRTLAEHPQMTTLDQLAATRIGLQTFARDFYILDRSRYALVESCYRVPFAFSPRNFATPVIEDADATGYQLLYVDKPKAELAGSRVLQYISAAEEQKVVVRYKGGWVTGYQNAPRLMRANRQPWYNLKAEVDRRGRRAILLPRRVFNNYMALWNKAGVVANEDFIEVAPKVGVSLAALLATLNSSVAEYSLRSQAQVYGGGVFNLNPGDAGGIRMLDLTTLAPDALNTLSNAWGLFVANKGQSRSALDDVVYRLLGFGTAEQSECQAELGEMRHLAKVSARHVADKPAADAARTSDGQQPLSRTPYHHPRLSTA